MRAEDFFAVLEKSKLLSTEQLAEARSNHADDGDAAAIARALAKGGLITRWQASQLLAGRSSFLLGKYKLIDLLGRGGMGSVFLGQHTMMNRRVALKILSKDLGKDPASFERFLSEARAAAALDHPNIVRAYSIDNEGDRYYIAMEYIDGSDLQRLVESEGPLEFDRAADYIRQAAEGLSHAHQQKMVHCDIKPSNLLVNNQGVVKILDMGLARMSEQGRNDPITPDEGVLGSVDYLAPEQAVASEDFDHRADIYALGCTFYFLLTGHPPFPEGTLPERIMKHQTQQPPSLSEVRPDTPGELARICEKMMAKKPADRYQSAEEVSQAIAQVRPPVRKRKTIVPTKKAEKAEQAEEPMSEVAAIADAALSTRPKSDSAKADAPAGKRGKGAAGGLLGTPQRLLIAGSVAALVLMGLAAIVIGSLSGPGTGKDQPQGSGKPVATRPGEEASTTPEKPDASSTPAPPEKPAAERPPAEKPPSEKPKPPDAAPPEPKPPAEPKTETPKPKPEEPAEKPAPEKPVEKPKPETPEEKPQPKPKPEPKPKKVEPLHDLAKSVTLPPMTAKLAAEKQFGDPVELGKVHLTGDTALDMALVGGKDVKGTKQLFSIERDAAAGAGQSWLVRSPSRDGPVSVARVWLDDEMLKWQWQEGAGVAANHLRFCGLALSAGSDSRQVPLIQSKHADPIVLDLDPNLKKVDPKRPVILGRAQMVLEWLPADLDAIHAEITGFEGTVKADFEKNTSITAKDSSKGVITLSAGKTPVTLHVTMNVLKTSPAKIDLSVTGTFVVTSPLTEQEVLVPFLPVAVKSELKQAQYWQKQNQDGQEAQKDPKLKKKMQDLAKSWKSLADVLTSVLDLCASVHKKGSIQYRVYYLADKDQNQQIELFNTKGGDVPAAAGEAKAPPVPGGGGQPKPKLFEKP